MMRLAIIFLAACWTGAPQTIVRTKIVHTNVPVECPWLTSLPEYPTPCDVTQWGEEVCADITDIQMNVYAREIHDWLMDVVVPSCAPEMLREDRPQ